MALLRPNKLVLLPLLMLLATTLIVANLAVGAITLSGQWGFYELMIVYWLEALVIGGKDRISHCATPVGVPRGRCPAAPAGR